jgi:hypothetical protein
MDRLTGTGFSSPHSLFSRFSQLGLQGFPLCVRNIHGKKTMSGIEDLMAESNERWTAAMRRAEGVHDNGLGEALKTYYTRYFPLGLALSVSVGAAIGALIFPDTADHGPIPLALGISLAACTALIGGLIYNAKKVVPAVQSGRIDVLLSFGERRTKAHPPADRGKSTTRYRAPSGRQGRCRATPQERCHPAAGATDDPALLRSSSHKFR